MAPPTRTMTRRIRAIVRPFMSVVLRVLRGFAGIHPRPAMWAECEDGTDISRRCARSDRDLAGAGPTAIGGIVDPGDVFVRRPGDTVPARSFPRRRVQPQT